MRGIILRCFRKQSRHNKDVSQPLRLPARNTVAQSNPLFCGIPHNAANIRNSLGTIFIFRALPWSKRNRKFTGLVASTPGVGRQTRAPTERTTPNA